MCARDKHPPMCIYESVCAYMRVYVYICEYMCIYVCICEYYQAKSAQNSWKDASSLLKASESSSTNVHDHKV